MLTKSRIITIVVSAVAAVLAVIAYEQGSEYLAKRAAQRAAQEAIRTEIAQHSAATETLLKLTYDETPVTYAQLFERIEQRAAKIDETVIKVSSTELRGDTGKAVEEYGHALSTVLSAEELNYRKNLALDNATETLRDAFNDYKASIYNEYTRQYEQQRAHNASREADEAIAEAQESSKDFDKALANLKATVERNKASLKEYRIVNLAILNKAIEHRK